MAVGKMQGHSMKASQDSSGTDILSARWMLHLLDVATGNGDTKKLIRRGSEREAEEFDLAAKCRGYAEAIIIDYSVKRLLESESVNGQAMLAKACQALLGIHIPATDNWKGFALQLNHERNNSGAFARASLLMLELEALANVVEWSAVLTACVLQIGQGKLKVESSRERPVTKPNIKTFGRRVVGWRHCVYASFALSAFQADLQQDSQWIMGHDKIANAAQKWKSFLNLRDSRSGELSPRLALDQILRKRCSVLPHWEVEEKLTWLHSPPATVDPVLLSEARNVSEELRVVLENAHILPYPRGEQAAS